MCISSCNEDRYKQIQQIYGKEFQNFIIREKSKDFFFRSVAKLKKNVSQTAQTQEKNYLREISKVEEEVQEYYKKISKELHSRQLGGIPSLEQMTGKSAQQILGLQVAIGHFKEFRIGISEAVKQEQIEIMDELTKLSLEYQQTYQKEQSPNHYLFNSLPQSEKDAIIKRAEMQYQSEISALNEYLLDKYDQQLKLEHYRQRLSNIDFKTQLEKLLNLSKDKLLTNLNTILAETISSYILIQ